MPSSGATATSPASDPASGPAPVRRVFLPFSRPTIEEDEIAEVVDSLRSGWITTGPKVARFEQMFKDRFAPCEAISVCSATAGLHIAIAALDLKPDDEVIVPSLTWASTANVVELCGARTVFADVDPDTLCIDPKDVERRVTARTKAIVPVHYAGQAADLDALRAIAKKHDLRIIEDAAHSLGTWYRGKEIGATGELVVYSFHPIKNITTGEGGMIVCRDEALAERMRLLRFHGVSKNAWSRYKQGTNPQYDVLLPGLKYNMLDLQAALGIRQLGKLDRFNAKRLELAKNYERLIQRVPELKPLGRANYDSVHCWHLYVVRLDLGAVTIGRNEVMQELQAENIGVGLHFTALHMSSWYSKKYGYKPGSLPNSELAGNSIFSLPLYPLLTAADQDDVVEALARVIGRHRRKQA
jgi:dTDP-4-amino-4,6-dideoxygalactose transaminase